MGLWLITLVFAGVVGFADRPAYETRQVAGWELRIQRKLLVDHPQQTNEAVRLLEQQLREVQQVCPPTP